MKKFLLAACVSTPSVKGIYTALFILMLTLPVFSQVEQTDKTPIAAPFQKWEVGFDLKPLFRSDEPYNVLGKWHFTERKAVRFGLGIANSTASTDSVSLFNQDFTRITSNAVLQYREVHPKQNKKKNGQFSIGYQYSIINNNKISFYSATDISYKQEQEDFNIFGGATFFSNYYLLDSVKSNIFSNKASLISLEYKSEVYGISQIIGFTYRFNNYLSLSSEFAVIFNRTHYTVSKYERIAGNSSAVFYTNSEFKSSGTTDDFSLKPLMGLYLNYHF